MSDNSQRRKFKSPTAKMFVNIIVNSFVICLINCLSAFKWLNIKFKNGFRTLTFITRIFVAASLEHRSFLNRETQLTILSSPNKPNFSFANDITWAWNRLSGGKNQTVILHFCIKIALFQSMTLPDEKNDRMKSNESLGVWHCKKQENKSFKNNVHSSRSEKLASISRHPHIDTDSIHSTIFIFASHLELSFPKQWFSWKTLNCHLISDHEIWHLQWLYDSSWIS